EAGSMLGTAAIMVMDETDCVVDCATRMVRFYAHESCGKCTPCREGSWWATRVLERLEDGQGQEADLTIMRDLGTNLMFRAYPAPAGPCRHCDVQLEGQAKLPTSGTVTVAPGMVVRTQHTSDAARVAQVANLEFLLLNHPLDCPICDRGGECPLQDQALAFGP